jgi:hypothetical protein
MWHDFLAQWFNALFDEARDHWHQKRRATALVGVAFIVLLLAFVAWRILR